MRNKEDLGTLAGGITVVAVIVWAICYFFLMGAVRPDAGEEAVLVDKPLFWGAAGIRPEPIVNDTIRVWESTSAIMVNMRPQQHQERYDNLMSQNTVPLDFTVSIVTKILERRSPTLYKDFGLSWYEDRLRPRAASETRDFAKQYTSTQLISDASVLNRGEEKILAALNAYLEEQKIPAVVLEVNIGRGVPPDEVISEMAATAAQDQRAKTEQSRSKAEAQRKDAEKKKAEADGMYRETMAMSNSEYLQLRQMEIQSRLAERKDIQVIMNMGPTMQATKMVK